MTKKLAVFGMTIAVLAINSVASAAVTFVYPSPQSLVSRSEHLVLKFNDPDITAVKITVNGLASDLLQVGTPEYRKAFLDILILKPQWDAGKNDIAVELYKGKELVDTSRGEIFYLTRKEAAPPADYRVQRLHVPHNEKLCVDCHNMSPSADQATSLQVKENSCYGCHKRMLEVKYVHGPAGTYSCGYCHSLTAAVKYDTPKRDIELCNECHAEKATEFRKRKYLHGPIAAGMCEVCHDPHGSNHPSQLKLPVNELCVSCHEEVRKTPHVVRTTTGGGHPVGDKPDPSAYGKGRLMSCVSCHDPHSGDVRYFFVNNAEDRMLLCQMCHNK
jgi:predicted CXXCH cytochrome family protein